MLSEPVIFEYQEIKEIKRDNVHIWNYPVIR